MAIVESLMQWIEAAGIGIITIGVITASVQCLTGLRQRTFDEAYNLYRRRLGQAILLSVCHGTPRA